MSDGALWYVSITDQDIADTIPDEEKMPGGRSWVGAAIVEAPDEDQAAEKAFALCPPGRHYHAMTGGPISSRAAVKPDYIGVLLTTTEDIERAGAAATEQDIDQAIEHDRHRAEGRRH